MEKTKHEHDEGKENAGHALRDEHVKYNTMIRTEHGDFRMSELFQAQTAARENKPHLYDERQTTAHDSSGHAYIVREQQYLLEIIPLDGRLPPYFGKWFFFGAEVLWTLFLWAGAIATIYVDGFDVYAHYFTNWMWTINLIYYTVDLLTFVDMSGRVQFKWIAIMWWPLWGNVSQVFFLVFIMFCDNPDIIGQPAKEYGLCPVLLVDRFKHVLPFVFGWMYMIFRHKDFRIILINIAGFGWRWLTALVLFNFASAHLILFGYWSNFDFYRVYGLSLSLWIGVLLVELIYILSIVIVVLWFSPALNSFRALLDKTDHRYLITDPVARNYTPKSSM